MDADLYAQYLKPEAMQDIASLGIRALHCLATGGVPH
jgi:hypothetical protein